MKSVFSLLSAALLVVGFSACDSHSWDETKVLFSHGNHGDHAEGGHGDAPHGEKADAHGEKAESHGDKGHEAKAEAHGTTDHAEKKDH